MNEPSPDVFREFYVYGGVTCNVCKDPDACDKGYTRSTALPTEAERIRHNLEIFFDGVSREEVEECKASATQAWCLERGQV